MLALIVAIGAQNAYVLRLGILRQHVTAVVLFCAVSDAALIALGVGGAGALIQGNAVLLAAARYGGAAFLAGYGVLAARRAWKGEALPATDSEALAPSLTTALAACFAFTYLNPHVYLDTVVLVGALAAQRSPPADWVFGGGAMLASLVWFAAIGFGARFLGPLFESRLAWRILDGSIAAMMLTLAAMLLSG